MKALYLLERAFINKNSKYNKKTGIDTIKQNNSNIATKLPPTGFMKKSDCQNSCLKKLSAVFLIICIENGNNTALITQPIKA